MLENHVGFVEPKPRQPGPRKNRIVLELGPRQSLAVVGVEPTVDAVIELLADALERAKKARQMRMGLKTFTSMLKDQQEA